MIEAALKLWAVYIAVELIMYGQRRGRETNVKFWSLVLLFVTSCFALGSFTRLAGGEVALMAVICIASLSLNAAPRAKAVVLGLPLFALVVVTPGVSLWVFGPLVLCGTAACYIMGGPDVSSKTNREKGRARSAA